MASLLASTIPSALSVCYEIDEFLNLYLKIKTGSIEMPLHSGLTSSGIRIEVVRNNLMVDCLMAPPLLSQSGLLLVHLFIFSNNSPSLLMVC